MTQLQGPTHVPFLLAVVQNYMASTGIEPATVALLAPRSNQLS